jgi:branched-chain amino acid transport system permease protein
MDKVNHKMRWPNSLIGWLCLLAIFILPAFAFRSQYMLYLSSLACIYIITSFGLNIILGYAGQISLAQAAFLGIGAYVGALLGPKFSFWVTLPLGGIIAFVLGLGLGFPSLKVKHHYLAMVTLGFNIIVYLILMNEQKLTGGPYGLFNIAKPKIGPLDFTSERGYHIIIAFTTFLLLLLAYWTLNSQWGRAFKAIRENELRAEMLGVSLRNYKLMAFAIGSGFAGIAGGLIGPLFGYIDPTMFGLGLSFQFLLMVVVGGIGRFEGPLIGAILITILPEVLRITERFYSIIFSFSAALIMVFMPKGSVALWDWFFKKVTGKEAPQLTK